MSDNETRIDPAATVIGGADIGRTLVVPAAGGRAGATLMDPGRTQIGVTITCPVCKSVTPSTETYCGDCGFLLSSYGGASISAPEPEPVPAELVEASTGRRHRLRAGANTVGRHTTDVLLEDHTVSRVHARIVIEEGLITVEDLGSSNGTTVSGVRLAPNQPATATLGAELKFASWAGYIVVPGEAPVPAGPAATIAMGADATILMESPPSDATLLAPTGFAPDLGSEAAEESAAPAAAGSAGPILKSVSGPAGDIPLDQSVITVGRRSSNTVVIANDAYVSGRHVELNTDAGGAYLTDVGSTNGTFVNGRQIIPQDRILLREGDDVRIGQTHYRFGWPSRPAASPSPDEAVPPSSAGEEPSDDAQPSPGD
jgi:pSer/pThr/pTyr-binding forkhead associated (FHA) protein